MRLTVETAAEYEVDLEALRAEFPKEWAEFKAEFEREGEEPNIREWVREVWDNNMGDSFLFNKVDEYEVGWTLE